MPWWIEMVERMAIFTKRASVKRSDRGLRYLNAADRPLSLFENRNQTSRETSQQLCFAHSGKESLFVRCVLLNLTPLFLDFFWS